MNYTRAYSDSTGDSHFEDVSVPATPANFAPPAPPMDVAAPMRAERMLLATMPLTWASSWHPAPRHQFYVQLSGTLEVQVSDGQVRQFPPGSLVQLEDTMGKGHCTRVVGNTIAEGVFVQLPAEANAAV